MSKETKKKIGRPPNAIPRVMIGLRVPLPVKDALQQEADEADVSLMRWGEAALKYARPDLPWGDDDEGTDGPGRTDPEGPREEEGGGEEPRG